MERWFFFVTPETPYLGVSACLLPCKSLESNCNPPNLRYLSYFNILLVARLVTSSSLLTSTFSKTKHAATVGGRARTYTDNTDGLIWMWKMWHIALSNAYLYRVYNYTCPWHCPTIPADKISCAWGWHDILQDMENLLDQLSKPDQSCINVCLPYIKQFYKIKDVQSNSGYKFKANLILKMVVKIFDITSSPKCIDDCK